MDIFVVLVLGLHQNYLGLTPNFSGITPGVTAGTI